MDKQSRQNLISRTSIISILVNIILAVIKIIIGMITGSLAIISEGVNTATDAISSVIMLAGTKLSGKHPDEKHPFGYGRIEYLTTLVLSILILYTGIEMLKSSIDGLLHPAAMEITYIAIAIVAISAVIKFFLGIYMLKIARQTESASLEAVGEECRNDAFLSIVTILSSVLYLTMHFSIDAIAGLLFAIVILKGGYESLMDTISEILGRAGKEDLAKNIYREIRHTDGIITAADLMLHNYGPDNYSGSVNIEIDHKKTIGEIYEVIHELQLRIMHEYHVTMVFGIYAVDRDHPLMREMRRYIGSFVKNHEHVTSYHALYLSEASQRIYVDLVVDYDLRDWDALEEEFISYMKEAYPENPVELVIETQYV